MRPVPRSRHLVALTVFIAVSGGYGYQAAVDTRIQPAQLHLATAAIKRHDPSLMRYDLVYGRSRMWQVHPPLFLAILETVLVPTEYRDPTLGFRVLTGVIALGYLCGMYSLLRRQCRSWSVSALVAVLSSAMVDTVGKGFWGAGALSSVTPEGLALAMVPLVALALLIYANRWRVLLVFGAVGAMGNIHLPTAVGLTLVMLVAYVAQRGVSLRSVGMAVACLLCAAIAAGPYVWYYVELRRSLAAANIDYSLGMLQAPPMAAIGSFFYGWRQLLEDLGQWALMLAIPATIVALVLSRVERFRVRDMRFWCAWAMGAVVIAAALHGAMYLTRGPGDPHPPTDLLRTAGLIMLPFYAMLAQTITNLFRILHAHRALVRTGCVVLTVLWMVPSDNARVGRHALLEAATVMLPDEDKPASIHRHRTDAREHTELVNIAAWVRQDTGPNAILIASDRIQLRAWGRRSMLATHRDLSYLHHLVPDKLDQWHRTWYAQNSLMNPTDMARIRDVVKTVRTRDDFENAGPWYVICTSADAPKNPGSLVPVMPPSDQVPDAWGKHYKVYQVP